jgi:transcriptional regulator with XRE-family HTH domain
VTLDSLGGRIRQLREERGMSLAKVAGADFSRAFLNQVELGKSQPSTRLLRVIANRLGAPVEYLLEGSTPSVDRQLALERARVDVLRQRPREALAALEPILDGLEWPLAVDARLCCAEALLALGRRPEATRHFTEAEKAIRARGDAYRMRRLRTLRSVGSGRAQALDARSLGEARVKLGERALRAGDAAAALEHFREGRVLLEATSDKS